MAKKSKNKRSSTPSAPKPKPPEAVAHAAIEDATAVALESMEHAEQAGGNGSMADLAEPVGAAPSVADLKTACQDARNAQARYTHLLSSLDQQQRTLERDRARIEKKQAEVDEQKSKNRTRSTELDQLKTELSGREADLARKDGEIVARDRAVRERELEAEAGFATKNREALASLEDEKASLDGAVQAARAELSKVKEEVRDARVRWDAEQHEQVQAALNQLDAQRADLAANREALAADRASVDKRRRDVEQREADLDEDRNAFEERLAHAIEREHSSLLLNNERLDARVHALIEQLTAVENEVAELRTARRRAQGRSPEELMQERDALREKVEGLEISLAERPGTDDLQRLRELERTREAERLEVETLRQQKAALQLKADRADLNTAELSTLRATKESYEAEITLLTERLRDLGGEIEKHHGTHGPFPLCTRLDGEPASTRTPDLDAVPNHDLAALADHARHAMAQRDPALYYDALTVRLFLAGLATSHLVLLEGISGTGKSSLPEAFADAVGGVAQSVAVQASWRDRHDLLGHYNAFERQFAETDLLRHLYQAQLPAYADRPYLVVLDEMNLARPEYYFADFLSKLEDRARLGARGEVHLGLVDSELAGKPLPRHLRRGADGISIRLPDNVWFVGTANHDESTLKFAPKTYDRAHVMELPRNPDRFKPARPTPLALSWSALEHAFAQAAGTPDRRGSHADAADDAWNHLNVLWQDRLFHDFKLSWGNRLERQVRRFAPVLAAAGGSATEAVDHLLASKVLAKLKGRFDLDPDHLAALADDLEAAELTSAAGLVRTEHRRVEA